MGNVKSVYNALKHVGAKPIIANSPSKVKTGKIVIPGVGAFGKGMENLSPFIPKIREASTSDIPLLGICLGMHMFFERSEESPATEGLGLMEGKVVKIRTKLRLPHIGWNFLEIRKETCPLFKGINSGYAYFVHSYHALPEENVVAATTSHGSEITASVWMQHVFGTQFHPEKSGALGLQILKNFSEL